MKKKAEKNFSVFEITGSEFFPLNCLYQQENTCHRHSVCEETVLRFCISLTETFCKAIACPVINKNGKGCAL